MCVALNTSVSALPNCCLPQPLSTHAKTAELRASRAVLALPSPLEFASYVFFFGGVLVGPCFEIKEYLDFTDLTLFKKVVTLAGPSSSFLADAHSAMMHACWRTGRSGEDPVVHRPRHQSRTGHSFRLPA